MTETRLKELFDAATSTSPLADFDLDRAVRAGRTRRRARIGGRITVVSGLVALAVTGTLVLADRTPTKQAVSAGPAVRSTHATASPSSPASPEISTAALERVARDVATPAGGTGTVADSRKESLPDGSVLYAVRLHVLLPDGGAFEVGVGVDPSPQNGVATWTQSCRLDNGGHRDAKACTPILEQPTRGIWSRTYPDQVGRQSLMLAATLPVGGTLTITVSNYVEQPDGSKQVGPALNTLGITASTLVDAADRLSS